MTELNRTTLGNFNINNSYTLEDINNDKYKLLSLEDFLDIEVININENMLFKIKNGQVLNKKTNKYILFKYNNENIALYQKYNDEQIKPLIMF